MTPSVIEQAQFPRSYEAARQSLAECQRLDECKDWADKSAALASYAKQAGDDELLKLSTQIKLCAMRRAGDLLKQIKPRHGANQNIKEGDHLNVHTRTNAAREARLSEHQQKTAMRVANVPTDEFEKQVESDTPPTITGMAQQGIQPRFPDPQNWLKGRDPKDFNRVLHFVAMAEQYAKKLAEWKLDEVLPHLLDEDRKELQSYIATINTIHNQIAEEI